MPGLHEKIADRIEEEIKRGKRDELPAASRLAEEYSCSAATILKAVSVLRDKGLVRFHRGTKIRITGRENPLPQTVRHVKEHIRNQVLSGKLKTGTPLEKAIYYSNYLNVGTKQIVEALRALSGEKIIHKRGRRWIVGPQGGPDPAHHAFHAGPSRDQVQVIMPTYDSWRYYELNPIVRVFLNSTIKELERFRIGVQLCFLEKSDWPLPDQYPQGQDEIVAAAKELSFRCRGMVLNFEYDIPYREWSDLLPAKNTPAILFLPDPAIEKKIAACDRSLPKSVVTASYNSDAGLELAVREIVDKGHRKAVYPMASGNGPAWHRERLENMKEICRKKKLPLEILPVSIGEINSSASIYPDLVMWQLRLSGDRHPERKVTRTVKEQMRLLKRHFPGFSALLDCGDATAIIAPNDIYAAGIYDYLRLAGNKIPEELSIISFDNNSFVKHYLITTVDFGLEELGYRIAHLIIGDIPIAPDHGRNLTSSPILRDRGSVVRIK